ncbi:hypothetical protein [uncultured Victivallis sp.]|mgnify:CR=1 FL=1|uniref:hypothetical protein n=1 Tax=uncultured Victivallis sp. TaxID=354118 RepID=UPI0025979B1B|nr:hypothetical protein [uncultured Victivallis sp.]
MIKQIKNIMENLPYPVGRALSLLPFRYRLGTAYSQFHHLANQSLCWSDREREEYMLGKLRNIVEHAKQKFPCYQKLYKQHGVYDLEINSLADFSKLPITDKAFFREHISEFSGAYLLNTGGTTGSPFSFYIDKNAWAREWAHMHLIWGMRDYHYQQLNLALRGKNLENKNIKYNPVHNEFLVNTYRTVSDFLPEIRSLFQKRKITYIHGYPSSVYNFIVELEKCCSTAEIKVFLAPIKGVLLHSEFPYPYMKEKFAGYQLPCISWYGHSEMAILAYDNEFNNHFRLLPTYGYAEVVGEQLLGTSFHNFDMPLIRYNTGDLVTPLSVTEHGGCTAFAINAGRSGDYIEDRHGKQIPLTSLIFGRHHRAFEVAEHVQIHQESPGKAVIYLIAGQHIPSENLHNFFDLSNVDVDFEIEVRNKPILTKAGKLRLKI